MQKHSPLNSRALLNISSGYTIIQVRSALSVLLLLYSLKQKNLLSMPLKFSSSGNWRVPTIWSGNWCIWSCYHSDSLLGWMSISFLKNFLGTWEVIIEAVYHWRHALLNGGCATIIYSRVYMECKLNFHQPKDSHMIKATQPFEQQTINF